MFSISFNSILFVSFYYNKAIEFTLDRSSITDGYRRSNWKRISRSVWPPHAIALYQVDIDKLCDVHNCNINCNVLISIILIHIGCFVDYLRSSMCLECYLSSSISQFISKVLVHDITRRICLIWPR